MLPGYGKKSENIDRLFLPPLPATGTYNSDGSAAFGAVKTPVPIELQRDPATPAEQVLLESAGMFLHILLY
jgi:hypothetical protein